MALSTAQMSLVEQRVANDGPSTGTAYLLWFFLGAVAGHRWYLGRPGTAILMILAWACFIVPGALWWLIDGFLISGMIRESKTDIRMRVTMELLAMTGGGEARPATVAAE